MILALLLGGTIGAVAIGFAVVDWARRRRR